MTASSRTREKRRELDVAPIDHPRPLQPTHSFHLSVPSPVDRRLLLSSSAPSSPPPPTPNPAPPHPPIPSSPSMPPPRVLNVTQLPNIVHGPKDHILTYKNFYPSGPKVQHTRLKYPYMSAQVLADNIAYNAGKGGEKTSAITGQLFQAMGNVGTGILARPITGMTVKVSGASHVEKTFGSTVKWHRGSLARGNTEKKMCTVQGRMGTRTTQVTLCSAAFPF